MAERKLTTAEILALARQKDGKGAGGSPAPKPEPPAEAEAAAPATPAADAPKPKPAAAGPRPSSTADILAAARAQAAGGGAAPKADKPAAKAEKPAAAPKAVGAKPAAPGPRPKSTADILAAARAQKAAGSAPAEAPAAKGDKPAKAKPAAAKSAAAPSGERPSVQEMLKRVRSEKEGAGETATKMPPLPQKPAPARVPVGQPRRNFLWAMVATPFAAAWTAFTATAIAGTLAAARFMMPNAVAEPPSKFKIGSPDDYPIGTVSTKWKAEYAIWITHQVYNGKAEIYALSTVCTHLGCTPNWLEGEQKYKCPCHGSGFYADGINFEGPAPRPLERYGISVAADGMLEVDKSVKFQQEMGQWEDAASYVATS